MIDETYFLIRRGLYKVVEVSERISLLVGALAGDGVLAGWLE